MKHVTDTFKTGKSKSPNFSLKMAMKAAKKTYKKIKGGKDMGATPTGGDSAVPYTKAGVGAPVMGGNHTPVAHVAGAVANAAGLVKGGKSRRRKSSKNCTRRRKH